MIAESKLAALERMCHEDPPGAIMSHRRGSILELIAEIRRLNKIIAQEVSENDELGSEFTYVMALKDENRRLREALEHYANPCGECERLYLGTCHGSPHIARNALRIEK